MNKQYKAYLIWIVEKKLDYDKPTFTLQKLYRTETSALVQCIMFNYTNISDAIESGKVTGGIVSKVIMAWDKFSCTDNPYDIKEKELITINKTLIEANVLIGTDIDTGKSEYTIYNFEEKDIFD